MKCPNCETEIMEDMKSCPKCGYFFAENEVQGENEGNWGEANSCQIEKQTDGLAGLNDRSDASDKASVEEIMSESEPVRNKKKRNKGIIIRAICEVVGIVLLIVSWSVIYSHNHNESVLSAENSSLSEKYDTLEASYDTLSETKADQEVQIAELEAQIAELEAQIAELENGAESQLVAIKNAYENGDWQTVVDLAGDLHEQYNGSAEDAEAQNLASQAQAEIDAEQAAAAEKEAQGYETGITYDQLARTPDDYTGQKVKFYGRVVQVIEGDDSVQIRLAVDGDYDTVLFGQYASSIVSSRVLEDDYITIYGTSVGTISYESTLGGTITIPGVYIEKIDQ